MEMTAIVLAAGLGQRMQSNLPKVMHNIAGKPMLAHILTTLKDLNIKDIRVVASEALIKYPPVLKLKEIVSFDFIEQKERLGTAHAVLIGLNKKPKHPILVLNGDVPLIKAQTISKFISKFLESKANVACLAFTAKNPYGYGRLCTYGNDLVEIIEEVDATAEQRKINLCNSGVFAIDHKNVSHLIDVIDYQEKLQTIAKKASNCLNTRYFPKEGINARLSFKKIESSTKEKREKYKLIITQIRQELNIIAV